MLLIDSREKGNLPKKCAKEFDNVIDALGAGDYWIPKDEGFIIIERSTYTDFAGKIMSGRLWEQMNKCLTKSDDVYFILENPFTLKYTKINLKALYSAIASLSRRVKIITTRNSTETFYVIEKLYDKYNNPNKKEFIDTRVKLKDKDPKKQAEYSLMGITGIGGTTASKLLKDRTLRELVNLSNDQLIEGYGKKIADKLIKVFDA